MSDTALCILQQDYGLQVNCETEVESILKNCDKQRNAPNYDNFEDFVEENTEHRFKFISFKQTRISMKEHPFLICITND